MNRCGSNNHQFIHGHASRSNGFTPTYNSWRGMIERCTNPNNIGWGRYGARGIRVCARWRVFANFLEDMGERPPGMSIDRRRSCGNYTPSNCRWATLSTQSRNQRKLQGTTSRYRGVNWHKCTGKWVAQATLNGRKAHLGLFTSERAAALAYRKAIACVP
jgi:hypothetical protein